MRGMSRIPLSSSLSPARRAGCAMNSDERVAPADLGKIEGGGGQPALQLPGPRRGCRPIHGRDERALASAAHRLKDLQVPERGGIEQEHAGAAVLLQAPQVLRLRTQVVGGIGDQGPGRAQRRMVARKPEAIEVQDAYRLRDNPGSRRGLEAVGGQFGHAPPGGERMQGVNGNLIVGRRLPALDVALGNQQLGRIERGQCRKQVPDAHGCRHLEFPGRKLYPRRVDSRPVEGDGAKVPVPPGFELVRRQRRAGAEDPRELPPDQLSGLGRLVLVADGDLPSRCQKLADIGVDGMVGKARHGLILPLREGEAEETRGHDSIVKEELEEVAQPEEEQRVLRQPSLHLEVLPHHRGEFLGLGHRLHSKDLSATIQCWSGAANPHDGGPIEDATIAESPDRCPP